MVTKPQTAKLECRETRSSLPPGRQPHWRTLHAHCQLGYFKSGDLCIWIARFVGRDGIPNDCRLGLADDVEAADGVRVLDFEQAQRAAENWYRERAIEEAGLPLDDSPFNKIGAACNRI